MCGLCVWPRTPVGPRLGGMRIILIAAFMSLWPVTASAQDLTPDQVRATFSAAGCATDAPIAWSEGVATVAVHDPVVEAAGWPVVRAFVYGDVAAAQQAHTTDQLLAGYGVPMWWGNVALVQVSHDRAAFPAEPDCAPVLSAPVPPILNAVDEHFASVLKGDR